MKIYSQSVATFVATLLTISITLPQSSCAFSISRNTAMSSSQVFSRGVGYSVTNGCRTVNRKATSLFSSEEDQTIENEKDGEKESFIAGQPPKLSQEQEDAVQWNLFTKHQAKGKWRGTWTSYDFMGDVLDTTLASVNLELDKDTNTVEHTHEMVMSSTSSDCETCFDSTETKTLPVATYSQGQMRKNRCASVAMVSGPSLLRSGTMSTELILSYGDGRVRVVYQHAPVWEAGVEPGSCPPQGLKLFRTLLSREALRDGPPTAKAEREHPPHRGDPKFFRPVPPFMWHKKWTGTSWTWGPQSGDRGWSIEEMEESDAWHGRPTGDTDDVWAMRLPGGILLQCPKVIRSGEAGLCRLAWLPEDDAEVGTDADGDTAKLLRVEASVMALEPVIDDENDVMIGFYPPSLGSLRCDVMVKSGELENVSMLEKLRNMGEISDKDDGNLGPDSTRDSSASSVSLPSEGGNEVRPESKGGDAAATSSSAKGDDNDASGLDAIRNALKL